MGDECICGSQPWHAMSHLFVILIPIFADLRYEGVHRHCSEQRKLLSAQQHKIPWLAFSLLYSLSQQTHVGSIQMQAATIMANAPRCQAQRRCVVSASAVAPASQEVKARFQPAKPTLFDVPVSNNGARVRFLIHKKGLDDVIDITSPATIGGLKCPEYLELNPQGKMPLLVLPDGTALPESQVIESYILDKYKGQGPDLLPATPELRALGALVARVHDQYIAPIQGCMYKPMSDPALRAKQIADISFQLDVLEKLVVGPFFCGEQVTYADSSVMPTVAFMTHILPRHFGWGSVFTNRPKLDAWWKAISADAEGARIIGEIHAGLLKWEADNRWEEKGVAAQVADGSFNWSCDC